MQPDMTVPLGGGLLNIRAGAILPKDGRFLMVGSPRADYLYSVGGRVKFGETVEEAVAREVYEETGLTIEAPRLCGVKQWTEEDGSYRYLVFLFRAERFTGELRSSDEGEVCWMPLPELQNRPLPSGFPEMLPLFLRDDLNETYHFLEDGKWRCENL